MGAGADWKRRREELGKTLEEASLELRISQRYLRGIEEGDYSRWPAKVFSVGFIRSYAGFLSVNPEGVLTEYTEFLDRQDVEESAVQTKPEWLEREHRRGSRRRVYSIATAVVLAVGVFLAWYARHSGPRPPAVPEVRQPPPPPVSAVPPPVDNAALPSDNAAVGMVVVPLAPERTTMTPAEGVEPGKVPSHGLSSLFLEAREMTWIMYSRDGSEPVDVMLYPGERLSIQAREKIFLKVGNAGGVIGTLNGKPLPPFGERGQVKEITLGK